MATKRGSAKKQGETLAKGLSNAGFRGTPKEKPAQSASNASMIDKAGASNVKTPTFMHERANLDKQDAATAALDKALCKTKELVATMAKSIAHAQSTESDDMKMACLDEIATLGNKARDKARAAINDAKKAQDAARPAKKPKGATTK
jgi:hypothetical protein